MYTPIPNFFSKFLLEDNEFKELSETILLRLFDSNETTYGISKDSNEFEAKLFKNKTHNLNYLLVKQDGYIQVYEEPDNTNSFNYLLKNLKSNSEVHARKIISLPINEGNEIVKMAKEIKEYFNILSLNKDAETPEVKEIKRKIKKDPKLEEAIMLKVKKMYKLEFDCNSNPYKLKVFYEFLYNQGLMSEKILDKKWIEKNKVPNKFLSENLEQLKTDVSFLVNVCNEKNFTSKKKHKYNDDDNFLYMSNKGMVLESQGMGSYVVSKDDEIVIYAWDKEKEGFLKNNTLSSLVSDIEKNENFTIDNVIFKSKGNNVEYVNINSWYCLSSDLEYTRNNIIDRGLGKMDYPIDIHSFEYQLKFAQQNYGYTKFEFLTNAFMTYSSEDYYDKKLGIFKPDEITYSKRIDKSKVKENESIPKMFSYCIPIKNISYLNKDWLEGLEYLIDMLKTHKPIPTVSATNNKEQDIKDAIEHFEKMLPKLKDKLNKKNTI